MAVNKTALREVVMAVRLAFRMESVGCLPMCPAFIVNDTRRKALPERARLRRNPQTRLGQAAPAHDVYCASTPRRCLAQRRLLLKAEGIVGENYSEYCFYERRLDHWRWEVTQQRS